MGLLMSDTTLIDLLLDGTLRLRDGLGEWAYALDATCDGDEHGAEDPGRWPQLTFQSGALDTDAEH